MTSRQRPGETLRDLAELALVMVGGVFVFAVIPLAIGLVLVSLGVSGGVYLVLAIVAAWIVLIYVASPLAYIRSAMRSRLRGRRPGP